MLNSDLVVTNQERDLGVATTSSEAAQCAGQVKEAKKLLGITRNGIKNMTRSAFRPVHKTLVHPHLGYYVQFWFSQLEDKVELQKVQKRATRMIKERDKLLYMERLKMLKPFCSLESESAE